MLLPLCSLLTPRPPTPTLFPYTTLFRSHRFPTHAGRCDRALARGAAEAAAGGGTRGGRVHLVLPRRARSGIRRDSRASVPVLPAPLGEPDPRGSGARPDEALPAVPPHACLLRTRWHGSV